jgi:hypothetical protein
MAFKSKRLEAIVLTLKRVFGINKYKHWKKVDGVGQFPQNSKKDYKYKKDDWEEILKGNDYY